MDDRKVSELSALKLAYNKQLIFACAMIVIIITGILLYILTLYVFTLQSLLMSIALILTGTIGLMTIDKKLKLISKKIRRTN